jgi:hypothetical protein
VTSRTAASRAEMNCAALGGFAAIRATIACRALPGQPTRRLAEPLAVLGQKESGPAFASPLPYPLKPDA